MTLRGTKTLGLELWIVEWLVSGELERIYEEAILVYTEHTSRLQVLWKTSDCLRIFISLTGI